MTNKDNYEKYKAYYKHYQDVHKNKHKVYNKCYYEMHKSEIATRDKRHYEAHKHEHAVYLKFYQQTHKAEVKVQKKLYYQMHKDERRIAHRCYCRTHPEVIKLLDRKRRALKLNVQHEPYTDNYVFERDGWLCGICGRKINKRLKYPNPLSVSLDHIIPLSKGGNDNPINVQAAHLRCNIGKNATNTGQLRMFG